jgi:phenylacetate-coenzyme A ligase PaaK-like adenylate-forming protein
MDYSEILSIEPFSLDHTQKERLLTNRLRQLTTHHVERCPEYARMMTAVNFDPMRMTSYYDIPPLPVRLFKELELTSIAHDELFKVMTSSGTTGQAVSKIFLDRITAGNQQKTLAKIVANFTGSTRMPMLILDSPSVIQNRAMFSARGAGILGFSLFASEKLFALNDEMELDIDAVEDFIKRHRDKTLFLFGFTSIIWLHFYQKLAQLDHRIDLSNGVLIHGGGWKKLLSEAVSKEQFKQCLTEVCGIRSIHDYYGMVEQTGCISMECEVGHLHTSVFSDIITRRSIDFSPCAIGEQGVIQVVSTIPESYPGHSLLTEDEGIILGEDDCPCGRKGKYFTVQGRLAQAELRGCSDTYAASL